MKLALSVAIALIAGCRPGKSEDPAAEAQSMRVYVGTYTRGASKGIYLFEMDGATGKLTPKGLVGETVNPSFLALHPSGRFLYAANEVGTFEGKKTGAVSAFSVNPTDGKLTFLNQHPSEGGAPCHIVVDRTGKNLLVANYTGGSVACLPIGRDGKLSPASAAIQHKGSGAHSRQKGPHAHSINLDGANRFAVAADLGLDKVLVYRFDPAKGTLVANDPPSTSVAPGSGPRHFAFHPDGTFGYVINELRRTVTAFAYDAKAGTLRNLQTVTTLPNGAKKRGSTAEVQVHPGGKFLYGSNRGHDSIATFSIDQKTGTLTPVGHTSTGGKTPRNFGIDPSGRWLLAANQGSGTVVVFRIDPKTGVPAPTGQTVKVPTPVCVKFAAVPK